MIPRKCRRFYDEPNVVKKSSSFCLLLYLIREDGKDDKDEVKTIYRSACRLSFPQKRFCVVSDVEDCSADDTHRKCVYPKWVYLLKSTQHASSARRGEVK